MSKRRNESSNSIPRKTPKQSRAERGGNAPEGVSRQEAMRPATTPEQLMEDYDQTPSQAEGERLLSQEVGSDDGTQTSMMDQSGARAEMIGSKPTPSQAEGERDTIDEDLREKGMGS